MNETPMLFPIARSEFWKQIRNTIEDVVTEKLVQGNILKTIALLPEKALLKAANVCDILQTSKPTFYGWLKQTKLKILKGKSR